MRAPTAGLLNPHSVTWRLHADPLLGLTVLRAHLLFALHPVAAAAGAEPPFGGDVWARVSRTTEYLTTTTFDDAAAALAAVARERAVLAGSVAVDPRTGAQHALDEPGMLVWWHLCLTESVLSVISRSGAGLDAADADRYLLEQVVAGALLGVDPTHLPDDLETLRDGFRQARPQLMATPDALDDVATAVAGATPHAAVTRRPAWVQMAGLAYATLPGWARRAYAGARAPGGVAALEGAAVTVALHALRTGLRGEQLDAVTSRRPSGLRKTKSRVNSLAHRTT
ncbi:oxygenase MpaB family protein, partial [Angustibacter aerolatus]